MTFSQVRDALRNTACDFSLEQMMNIERARRIILFGEPAPPKFTTQQIKEAILEAMKDSTE